MKKVIAILFTLALTACGPDIRLVPRAYMPDAPEILMRPPQDLQKIKSETETIEEPTRED